MIQKRRFPSINYLLSLYLLLLWCMSHADGQDNNVDTAVKDRFLQEAPGKWERYESRLQYLQGNQRSHLTIRGTGGAAESNAFLDWKANETSKLLIKGSERTLNGKTTMRPIKAIGSCSRYAFILERRTKESAWLLTEIVEGGLADVSKRDFPKGYPEFNALLITFHQGVRLRDIVKRNEFQITACREIGVDGEASVEVAFDFDNKGIEEKFPFQGGKIVLDPRRLWCLRSYEARLSHPVVRGTSVFKVLEYGVTEGSFPWPKHVVIDSDFSHFKGTKKTADFKKKEDFTFDLQIPAKLPSEDEFSLAAFGLPEPTWLAKKSTPWHLIFAAFGTVCLGVFFFLRFRAKRAGG